MRLERQKNEQEGVVSSEDFPSLSSLGSGQSRNSYPCFTVGETEVCKTKQRSFLSEGQYYGCPRPSKPGLGPLLEKGPK